MRPLLRRLRLPFVALSLLDFVLGACSGKTADSTTASGGATRDTSTLTSTSTGISSNSGGASSSTGFQTATALARCMTYDAGACNMSSVEPLPSASDLVKVELTEICYGIESRTKLVVATSEATQLDSLYEATMTGLATRGGTFCQRSCPASFVFYRLAFTLDDGRTLFVRILPGPSICGSVNVEGTDCVPPADADVTLSKIVSIFDLDAGAGSPILVPMNCDVLAGPDAQ